MVIVFNRKAKLPDWLAPFVSDVETEDGLDRWTTVVVTPADLAGSHSLAEKIATDHEVDYMHRLEIEDFRTEQKWRVWISFEEALAYESLS